MSYRISPIWWPLLAAASPALAPLMALRYKRYRANCTLAEKQNRERLAQAEPLDLPALKTLELTALVEHAVDPGFKGEAGVSYLLRSDRGSLLFDVGFGDQYGTLAHNVERLGLSLDDAAALVISHLHLDHMGGMKAQRAGRVAVPPRIGLPPEIPCFVPDEVDVGTMEKHLVDRPQLLAAGLGSTGPLARPLFFLGMCQEQALVARLEGRGLAVITGCGHPTIELILRMVRKLSDEPIKLIAGGLHFPISGSRNAPAGIQLQSLAGTGYPPWRAINDQDLSRTIAAINDVQPERLLLSAHDTCDRSLERMRVELNAEVEVLRAGASYKI
ncbi:MAG: MBL fold metallo-hydrolase [Candidatus Alcyoniella australis]|nr:MBL fold metallo-hydrolase [Candidatus Alcyoniella australis]